MQMSTCEALALLEDEITRARRKSPNSAMLFEALGEEVGKLAQVLSGDTPRAAIQVACMAIRIATEDFVVPNQGTLLVAEALEKVCKRRRNSQPSGGRST